MSAPTRQEMEAQIAQFIEPWAWETTSYNATTARDDALAKAAQIVEAFPALASQAAQPAEADGVEERKFYLSEWPLSKLLEARDRGLLTDNGEAWRYRYSHKDGTGGEYDLLYRPATPKAPTSTAGEVDGGDLHDRLLGRARFLRDRGEIKSPELLEQAAAALATPPAPNDDLRAALEWYAERVADCRKITPEGDNARQALDLDGGKRARAALKENRRG